MSSKTILWFTDFVGVGYRYYDVYMNIFPIFIDKMYAFKLWKRTINWWPDDQIKIRFVEINDTYWFILYGGSDYKDDNTGFAKNISISENYERFKSGYENKAILRFGVYKQSEDSDKFDLILLKKSKMVYDIKFLKYSTMPIDSIESQYIRNRGDTCA
jgi:hypothetical protein